MTFDAYHQWLSIPPEEQPPNHYRLLGVKLFEDDLEVIAGAADRQMTHVRAFQTGKHSAVSQQILNQISAARVCLLNAEKKRVYDTELRDAAAAAALTPRLSAPASVTAGPPPARMAQKPKFSPGMLAAAGAGVVCVLGVVLLLAMRSEPKQVAAVDQAEQPKPETAPNVPQDKPQGPSPGTETSKPEASRGAPSEDARSGKETSQLSEEKEPLPCPELSRHLNDLSQWKVDQGEWKTENGQIVGAGNSALVFNHRMPEDFTLEVTLHVISGMRPRIRLPGFHVGNEGGQRVLSLHKVKGIGPGFPYEHQQAMKVRVVAKGAQVQLYVNDVLVRECSDRKAKEAEMRICGGDSWSRGTTAFSTFSIGPPPESISLALASKADEPAAAKSGNETVASPDSARAETAMPAPASPADLARDAVLAFTFEKGSFARRDGKLYVKDLSGHGNHGLVNEAKLVEGRVGSALQFSTDQSYVECIDSASLRPKCVTVCAWIKSQSRRGTIEDIVAKLEWSQPRGYTLRRDAQGSLRGEMGSPGWRGVSSDIVLETQQWYHVASTYDEKTLIVYVDGVQHASSVIDHAIVPARSSLFIAGGKYENEKVDERFDGIIDEVAIFSRALTDKEIQSVYQLGVKGEHLIASSQAESETVAPEPSPTKKGPTDPRAVLALLKKKLRGRASYEPKTGQFSLTYDWNSKLQLQDFDVSKAKLAFTRGRLSLQGGESIRHKVDFQEVVVEVPVLIPQMQGRLLQASGGVSFSLGGPGHDRIYLSAGQRERIEATVLRPQTSGIQPVSLTMSPNRLAFAYGAGKPTQLGRAVESFHAGQMELWGGDAGYQFGKLVLTGTIDENWLKLDLEERSSQTPAK